MKSGFLFALQEGMGGLPRGGFHSFVVGAATTLAVGVLGCFYYGSINLQKAAQNLLDKFQFEAFISLSVPDSLHDELQQCVQKLDPHWKITYISRQEAAARFAREFDPTLFNILEENPLPASLTITLPPASFIPDSTRVLAQRIQSVEGIEDLIYDQQLLALLQEGQGSLFRWGLIAGMAAVLLAVGLTYNVVRLKIDAQRETIKLMSLLGATPGTQRGIYLVQGIILGMIGGLISAGGVALAGALLQFRFSPSLHLELPHVWLLMPAGGLLGMLGALLAAGKYLKE